MFDLETVNDVLVRVTNRGPHQVMLWQDDKIWEPITSDELSGLVRALVSVFLDWGICRGDRIVLLSENRWEWPVCDFATLAIGAVDVPLYATLTPDQIGYMVRDCAARVAIVSTEEQYTKLLASGDIPSVEHVVIMDRVEITGVSNLSSLLSQPQSPERKNTDFTALLALVLPSDLATIIYTSGTTGESKGVMLTHENLASNINVSTGDLGFNDQDTSVSFLPLSHVTARHVDYALMCHGVRLAYCPRFELLPEAMKTIQPTIFVAVPRVYEKIRHAVESKSAASPVRKRLLATALSIGHKHRESIFAGRVPVSLTWKLMNKLVFRRIREAFGGRVKVFNSGGAPLGVDTAGWFADAGIRIFEGYGLTETAPVIAVNYPNAYKLGSVGRPLSNIRVRFAPDGELEVTGPSVFHGYWNKVEETAEAFTNDGWFKTGDIGRIDEENFLFITDRKKELIKTSGGKLIAPQPIENRLKANKLIAQAALVGDRHKFACVLISPNFLALEDWTREQGVVAFDRGVLLQHPKVLSEYQGIINQVNSQLANFESIKRFALVPDEWTIEQGELTPSMKLKRRVVEKKYAAQIGAFYADEAHSRADGDPGGLSKGN